MKLCEAIELFLSRYTKKATQDSFKYPLRSLQSYVGENRPVDSITIVDVERWNVDLSKRDLAPASKDNYRKGVKTFFNYLVKIKEIPESPATQIKFEKKKEPVARKKAMPDSKLAKLISYCKWKKCKRDVALVCFLADSGARIGEAENLREDQIEWENNRAWIDGKTGGRYVPFFEEAARWMKQWLLERKRYSPYVFSKNGKKQTQLDQEFRRATIEAGIGSWGPHSLRHRKGYQYSDSRISANIAQKQFGHSDVKITLDYYYPQDWERVESAAKELSLPSAQDEETNVIRPDFKKKLN